MLQTFAKQLKKPKEELKIYDPYYCDGKIAKDLGELGYTDVYNKCEDFGKVLKDKKVPKHDIVVTMPPLSEESIEKCFKFCIRNDKPWMILLPYYLHKLSFYKELVEASKMRPFYVVPHDDYDCSSPGG